MSPFPQSAKCRYLKFILGTCCRLICFLHGGQSVFNQDQFVHYILFYFGSQRFLFDWRNPHGHNFFPWFLKIHWYALFINHKRNIFPGSGPGFPQWKRVGCAVKDVLFNLISCHLHVLNFSPFISHFLENPDNNHFLSLWRREKCSNV